MVEAPLLNETALSLLIELDIDDGTKPSEAITDAFLAGGVAIYEKPSALDDWIGTDVIDELVCGSSEGPLYISAPIWDHRVVVTEGSVRIYTGTVSSSDSRFRIDEPLH